MKNTIKFFVLLLVSMTYISCGDDEPDTSQSAEGSVEMALKVTYDGEPLILSDNYIYPDGKAMYFTRFSFYMSELTLRTDEGVATSDAINYLRLGQAHSTAAMASEGLKFNLNNVNSGDYVNLSFGIGVPAEENAMEPADFPSTNDLSLGEHWPGWNSYIFCKVEGVIDFDNDGNPESDFALHLGADEAFVNIEIDKDFTVNDGMTTEVILPIELKNLFENGSIIFDIESNPKIHNLSQSGAIAELANNLTTCF